MKRPATTLLLAAALLVCFPFATRADIFQYTDEKGVVHFTNVSTGGKRHKRVRIESGPSRKSADPRRTTPGTVSSSNIPSNYIDIINRACERHGVDPSLVHALVKVESDFNPYALSRKGAMGLMQLMPGTAFIMNVKNSFDPAENIDAGVRYLRYLLDRYEGNLSLALAAYNSGETAVRKWGTIPPFKETQNYVQRILKIYNGGRVYTGGRNYVTRYTTIYMGYGDDGALILTDNPSTHPDKKLKARKRQL